MINIDSCTFTYGSNIFLKAGGTSRWGSTGSNGGVVTLNLKNQKVVGNFVVDEYSGLTINLENSSIQGTINSEKTGAKVAINIDESSTITLTGNSYYTSINNGKSDGSNIIKGSYSFDSYEEKDIERPSGNGGSNPPSGGSGNPPEPPSGGSGNPPSGGSGNPPEPPSGGSGNPPGSSNEGNPTKSSSGNSTEESSTNGAKGNKDFIKMILGLMIVLAL
jgi:hypothetical protein